jgi:uncharacterized protein YqjF (DUF2071 family)
MLTDTIECTIERRLLVNYRIDPEVVMKLLPAPLRPQLVSGHAVGGICFLRLARLRPAHFPSMLGSKTENVAHRFAVEWDDDEGTQAGVFVPRRDTSSRLTALAGDKLFPGAYHVARFKVHERGSGLRIAVDSPDGTLALSVSAYAAPSLGGELFGTVDNALTFFRQGSLGFSPSGKSGSLIGVRLLSMSWEGRPVSVDHMASSLFDDDQVFPKGSCTLDSALVMRDIPVRWCNEGALEVRSQPKAA